MRASPVISYTGYPNSAAASAAWPSSAQSPVPAAAAGTGDSSGGRHWTKVPYRGRTWYSSRPAGQAVSPSPSLESGAGAGVVTYTPGVVGVSAAGARHWSSSEAIAAPGWNAGAEGATVTRHVSVARQTNPPYPPPSPGVSYLQRHASLQRVPSVRTDFGIRGTSLERPAVPSLERPIPSLERLGPPRERINFYYPASASVSTVSYAPGKCAAAPAVTRAIGGAAVSQTFSPTPSIPAQVLSSASTASRTPPSLGRDAVDPGSFYATGPFCMPAAPPDLSSGKPAQAAARQDFCFTPVAALAKPPPTAGPPGTRSAEAAGPPPFPPPAAAAAAAPSTGAGSAVRPVHPRPSLPPPSGRHRRHSKDRGSGPGPAAPGEAASTPEKSQSWKAAGASGRPGKAGMTSGGGEKLPGQQFAGWQKGPPPPPAAAPGAAAPGAACAAPARGSRPDPRSRRASQNSAPPAEVSASSPSPSASRRATVTCPGCRKRMVINFVSVAGSASTAGSGALSADPAAAGRGGSGANPAGEADVSLAINRMAREVKQLRTQMRRLRTQLQVSSGVISQLDRTRKINETALDELFRVVASLLRRIRQCDGGGGTLSGSGAAADDRAAAADDGASGAGGNTPVAASGAGLPTPYSPKFIDQLETLTRGNKALMAFLLSSFSLPLHDAGAATGGAGAGGGLERNLHAFFAAPSAPAAAAAGAAVAASRLLGESAYYTSGADDGAGDEDRDLEDVHVDAACQALGADCGAECLLPPCAADAAAGGLPPPTPRLLSLSTSASQPNPSSLASSCGRLFDRLRNNHGTASEFHFACTPQAAPRPRRVTEDCVRQRNRSFDYDELVQGSWREGSVVPLAGGTDSLALTSDDEAAGLAAQISAAAAAAASAGASAAAPGGLPEGGLRPPIVPLLGLDTVGAGQWLSGEATAGDTYPTKASTGSDSSSPVQ